MSPMFAELRERLLVAGVRRGRADRYVAELRDHLADLIADERTRGATATQALDQAQVRLGEPEALVGAMCARQEFRAWTARAPMASFLLTPPLLLGLGTASLMLVVVLGVSGLAQAGSGPPPWMASAVDRLTGLSNAALGVLFGWALIAVAIRQRSSTPWLVLGLVALAATGAALQVAVTLPSPGTSGEIDLKPAGFTPRFALNFVAMLTPYVALRSLLPGWPAQTSSLAEGVGDAES